MYQERLQKNAFRIVLNKVVRAIQSLGDAAPAFKFQALTDCRRWNFWEVLK